jgi:hypothetical protein
MTALPDVARLAALLTNRIGISLAVTAGKTADGVYVDVRPEELPATRGFVVRTLLGWRHVRVQFHSETYAKQMLNEMAGAVPEQHAGFVALASLVADRGGRISMAQQRR